MDGSGISLDGPEFSLDVLGISLDGPATGDDCSVKVLSMLSVSSNISLSPGDCEQSAADCTSLSTLA